MSARDAVVAAARDWVAAGTPFVHQASLKGAGADCVGLLIGVGRDTGIAHYTKPRNYRRRPDPVQMRTELREHCIEIAFSDLLLGDIIWFRLEAEPQHVAIVTQLEPMMIAHAWGRPKIMRCVEMALSPDWLLRVDSCWRYRGLA